MRTRDHLDVWQQPNGYWRWAYVERSTETDETRLLSNREFHSAAEASHAATAAYPDSDLRVTPSVSLRPISPSRLTLVSLLTLLAALRAIRRRRTSNHRARH